MTTGPSDEQIAQLDADFKREFNPNINIAHYKQWKDRKASGYYKRGCIFDLLIEMHDFIVIPEILQELDEEIIAIRKKYGSQTDRSRYEIARN